MSFCHDVLHHGAPLIVAASLFALPLGASAQTRFSRTTPVANEPVVADNRTGLMWLGCPYGTDCVTAPPTMTWQDALQACHDLSHGGYDDWRLPNTMELMSIVETRFMTAPQASSSSCVDPTAFPGTGLRNYWTSTTFAADTTYAWFVAFDLGHIHFGPKSYLKSVRCVRTN